MSNLNVTDEDREFALQIIEDFDDFEEGITDHAKMAQWVRNVRQHAERKAAAAVTNGES